MTALDLRCPGCGQLQERPSHAADDLLACAGCGSLFLAGEERAVPPPPAVPLVPVTAAPLWVADVLACLDVVEAKLREWIAGMGHFLSYSLWCWLGHQLHALGRVGVKGSRVLALFAAWFAIAFGPLWLASRTSSAFLVIPALVWTALALAGSAWGARRLHRRPPQALLCPDGNGSAEPAVAGTP